VSESILNSVKKVLNLPVEYTAFDQDVIMFINTAFGTLNQLGVGPDQGFEITNETPTWEAFLGGDPRLNPIQTYVYLRVRLLFDPPTVGYHVDAIKEQIKELEWRLNVQREDVAWTSPTPPSEPSE
jgi:hypothetical protein